MAKKQAGQPERLWTVDEVASHVGVNIETVRRWLRTGALRGIRLGTKAGWRIRERDLEAYLEQRIPVGHPAMVGGRAKREGRGAISHG
jgi:excisionase family DNA binding protein